MTIVLLLSIFTFLIGGPILAAIVFFIGLFCLIAKGTINILLSPSSVAFIFVFLLMAFFNFTIFSEMTLLFKLLFLFIAPFIVKYWVKDKLNEN